MVDPYFALFAAIVVALAIVGLAYFAFDHGFATAATMANEARNNFEAGRIMGRAERVAIEAGEDLPTVDFTLVGEVPDTDTDRSIAGDRDG